MEYKKVKRAAEIGEFIIITACDDKAYDNGDIFKAEDVSRYGNVVAVSEGERQYVLFDEYHALEPSINRNKLKISGVAKGQYKQLCPYSWHKCNGDHKLLEYKIKRAADLGKVTHTYSNGSRIVRYYNLNLLVSGNEVMTIWYDKSYPRVGIDESLKEAHMNVVFRGKNDWRDQEGLYTLGQLIDTMKPGDTSYGVKGHEVGKKVFFDADNIFTLYDGISEHHPLLKYNGDPESAWMYVKGGDK